MMDDERTKDVKTSIQNIAYYDGIASAYDAILNEDSANAVIRALVSSRFTALVKKGCILDFGGGTGQDLTWQIKHYYRIIFCEPAVAMRGIARERSIKDFSGAGIHFLENSETDFRKWKTDFPFRQRVDAVLANFAVLNCIPDLAFFFEKLALVVKPGAVVLALMLDTGQSKTPLAKLKGWLRAFISGRSSSMVIDYNGKRQRVYLHRPIVIKKSSSAHFEFKAFEPLKRSGFCLIHLVRK
jgi:SAM-dependent methyltransferase